jgi:hypothetical protein
MDEPAASSWSKGVHERSTNDNHDRVALLSLLFRVDTGLVPPTSSPSQAGETRASR